MFCLQLWLCLGVSRYVVLFFKATILKWDYEAQVIIYVFVRKVLYGFLSDCVPIGGLRRKPYFMFGWLLYVISNLVLVCE